MAQLSILHAHTLTIADWASASTVVVENSTGGTTTNYASNLVLPSDWNSVHSASISIYDSDLPDMEFFEPYPPFATAAANMSAGTWYLSPFILQKWLESGHIMFPEIQNSGVTGWFGQTNTLLGSTSTASASRVGTFYDRFALFKPGDGANNSVLNSFWSGNADIFVTDVISASANSTNASSISATHSATLSMPVSWDASGGVTYSTFTGSGTTSTTQSTLNGSVLITALSTNLHQFVSGSKMAIFPFATTLGAGAYVMGRMYSTTYASTSAGYNVAGINLFGTASSYMAVGDPTFTAFKQMGKSTTDGTSCVLPWQGFWSTTGTATTVIAPPSNITSSDVRYTSGRLYWAKDERARG